MVQIYWYMNVYCASNEPIHTALESWSLLSTPPTTTILFSTILIAAGPFRADGIRPMTFQQ